MNKEKTSENLIHNNMSSAEQVRPPDCLNTIRFLAACQVVLGHASFYLKTDYPHILHMVQALFYGVPIFFVLSGFLIWQSVGRTHNYTAYLKKRFWRIYPEMWLAVVLEVIVMCILYQKNIPTWDLVKFVFTQSTFMQFWTPASMREYGCGTPNALWTICILIQFYIVVWPAYKLLHNKKIGTWIITLIVSFAAAAVIEYSQNFLPEILYKLLCNTFVYYFWMFIVGILLAEYKDKILPFLKKYWLIFIAVAAVYSAADISIPTPNYSIMAVVGLPLGWIGFAYRFPQFNIKKDISYGIYIYHCIVINAMLELGYTGKMWCLIITFLLTFILAYFSGKLAGSLKNYVNRSTKNE